MKNPISRRDLLTTAAAVASAALPIPAMSQGSAGRVVVVGGGFAGTTCARFIRRIDPRITVTLVEGSPVFIACPLSNAVTAGLRDLQAQQFGLDKVADDGVVLARAPAIGIDTQARFVALTNNACPPGGSARAGATTACSG